MIYKVTNRVDIEETHRFIDEYRASNAKTITFNQFKKTEEIKLEKDSIASDADQRAVKQLEYQVSI